jgi:hypothetical protein
MPHIILLARALIRGRAAAMQPLPEEITSSSDLAAGNTC